MFQGRLDNYERSIIHFIAFRGESTTNQIAVGVGISWATADDRLSRLYRKGYVRTHKGYWSLKY